jgi:hypothetical protein
MNVTIALLLTTQHPRLSVSYAPRSARTFRSWRGDRDSIEASVNRRASCQIGGVTPAERCHGNDDGCHKSFASYG